MINNTKHGTSENGNDLKPHSLIDVQYFFNTIASVSRSSWIHSTWSAHITLHIVHADQLKRAATGALIMLILLRDSWVEQGAVQQSRTELFM